VQPVSTRARTRAACAACGRQGGHTGERATKLGAASTTGDAWAGGATTTDIPEGDPAPTTAAVVAAETATAASAPVMEMDTCLRDDRALRSAGRGAAAAEAAASAVGAGAAAADSCSRSLLGLKLIFTSRWSRSARAIGDAAGDGIGESAAVQHVSEG
jgi:hypothetical protein